MKTNRTKLSWWDRMMAAVTFAEAGEEKTSLEFLKDRSAGTKEDDGCCVDMHAGHGNCHCVSTQKG